MYWYVYVLVLAHARRDSRSRAPVTVVRARRACVRAVRTAVALCRRCDSDSSFFFTGAVSVSANDDRDSVKPERARHRVHVRGSKKKTVQELALLATPFRQVSASRRLRFDHPAGLLIRGENKL